MLKTNLKQIPTRMDNQGNVVASMQDILILLTPYLSSKESRSISDLCLSPDVLKNKDNGVQKRGYKLLSKLVSLGKIQVDAESLYAKMDEVAEDTLPAAKKVSTVFQIGIEKITV